MEQMIGISDYLRILRRRSTLLWSVFGAVFVIAVLVTLALPSVYTSSGTILIEQQEIPAEMIKSTIGGYAAERMQIISQQVMTTANLGGIIQKYNLYPDERKRDTLATVVDQMREDIVLTPVSANVVDPKSGKPTTATIAFTLAYSNKSPELAQRVANELATLFLNENLKQRTQQTREASRFLAAEAEKWQAQVTQLENELSSFKGKYGEVLPELTQINQQAMLRAEQQLSEFDQRIRVQEERRIALQGQLAQLSPNSTLYSTEGRPILGNESRLKSLEAEYVSRSASYGPDHPDIIKMKKEIEALRKEVTSTETAASLAARQQQQQAELQSLRERYSADHPDVKRLERQIAETESALARASSQQNQRAALASKPDNPVYIQMQAQLQAAESELKSLQLSRKQVETKIAELEQRMKQMPEVEQQYRKLTADLESARKSYADISAKQVQAQLSEVLEKEQKGERFTLVEPPPLPENPTSPNRPAILFLGLVLAVAAGVGSVATRESLDETLHGAASVNAVLGLSPLATIPYILTERDLGSQRRQRRLVLVMLLMLAVVLLAVIHFFIMPLDIIWFSALRRLGI